MKDKKDESRSLREYWLGRIEAEEDAHKQFRDVAKEAVKAYQDKDMRGDFPIFWSTVQVTKAAIYAREPKPDVRKRNSTDPKSADNIAQAIEKALLFFQDTEDMHRRLGPAVEDFLVTGLGTAKVELVTETQEAPVIDPMTQEPILDEEGNEVLQEFVSKQAVRVVHWPWCYFRWEPAGSWDKVTWISFDHVMTKEEIKKQFGVTVKESGDGQRQDRTSAEKYGPTYLVHEIWDRETGRRIFVSECCEKELEVDKVPLDLEGFWPCPMPMVIGAPTDDFVPQPDYTKIKKQCEFIDDLSKRIKTLAKAIRNIGFFDASFSELGQLESASDTVYFPVNNLLNRIDAANSGGRALGGVMVEVDNTPKAGVLASVMEQREVAKAELFETLGIADIVRGATNSSETATAQQIKGQWANVRIGPKIQAVNYFIRNLLRIMGEVVTEHLDDEQLAKVSGTQLTPEELQALRAESRVYVVDVETDATLAQDEQAEKTQRLEVLKTATEYMNGLLPAVQQGMIPADVAKEFLLFAIASFKYGRQLQDVINQLPGQQQQLAQAQQQIQQLTQQGEQAQAQLQEAQGQLAKFSEGKEQRETALAQADVQLKGAQAQKTIAEAQTVGVDAQAKQVVAQANVQKAQIEAQASQVELATKVADAQRKEQEAARKAQLEDEDRQRKMAFEMEDRQKAANKRRRVRGLVGGEQVEIEVEE